MSKAAELAALIGGQKALGNKNIIKNGAMVVAQRGTSATGITGSGLNTVDRMYPEIGTAGTWTQSQSTDTPSGQGFAHSFKMDCTTADASLAAGHFCILGYRIEGIDLQRLNYGTSGAKNMVLSFWVKTSKTGNYVVNMQNVVTGGTSRTCGKVYTVSQANTWQKVEFPIAADTTTAFDNDNALTAIIYWWLASGTTYTSGTLSNTWENISNPNIAAGQAVNLADSTSNDWSITGIQLEEGDVATAFEVEDIGTTLARCQRYYFRTTGSSSGYGNLATVSRIGNTLYRGVVEFPVTMRSRPSFSSSGSFQTLDSGFTFSSMSGGDGASFDSHGVQVTMTSNGSAGQSSLLRQANDASAALIYDAEL
tara:strand:- start:2 stop:1099 length:1098 start_codon:yes stop_codon:yes gene_type:complete